MLMKTVVEVQIYDKKTFDYAVAPLMEEEFLIQYCRTLFIS